MRIRAIVTGAALGLVLAIVPTLAQQPTGQDLQDELEEARLNVELLSVESEAVRNQLTQHLQMLMQMEHEFPGMGSFSGMGGTTPAFEPGVTEEEARKRRDEQVKSVREWVKRLRAATLEAGKKLRRERRRVAELERSLDESPSTATGPDLERRLASMERKLDQLLKELSASKDRR